MSIDVRKQAIPVLTVVAGLVGVGVVLQLWLLSASVDGALAGKDVAVAATAASALLFLINAGLLGYVLRIDRRVHDADGDR